ncbi:DUF6479 family protein [Streptomyces mirabilis]|uniref:DUF6479 family protein n=1 Tax=Streptomyces mirabilis TaxID=68239 RepID=UPI0036CA3BEC
MPHQAQDNRVCKGNGNLHLHGCQGDAAIGTIGAFLGGLVVAGVLMWAVRLGMTVRRREPRRRRGSENQDVSRWDASSTGSVGSGGPSKM